MIVALIWCNFPYLKAIEHTNRHCTSDQITLCNFIDFSELIQFKVKLIFIKSISKNWCKKFFHSMICLPVMFHCGCQLSGFRSSLQPEPIYLRPDAAVRAAEAAASEGARMETSLVVSSPRGRCFFHQFTGVK